MKKRKLFILNLILVFIICSLNYFQLYSSSSLNNEMIIHYIDVGQGDCILIQVNEKNLLIGLMSIFWTQKVKLFYAALLANNSH